MTLTHYTTITERDLTTIWQGSAGAVSVDLVTFRGGDASLRFNPGAGANGYVNFWDTAAIVDSDWTIRFYIRVTTTPGVDRRLVRLFTALGVTRHQLYLKSTGRLEIRDSGGGVLGVSATAVNDGVWHCVEFTFDAGVASKLAIDGVEEINVANVDAGAREGTIGFDGGEAAAADINCDDFVLRRNEVTYWGPSTMAHMTVNADGDTVAWSNPFPSANHWENVDDRPPDGDASYNHAQNVAVDLYNLTASGLPGGTLLNNVRMGYVIRDEGFTGPDDIGCKDGGVEYWTSVTFPGGYTFFGLDYPLRPGGGAWNAAALDALQIGARRPGAGNRWCWITAAWVTFDYVVSNVRRVTQLPIEVAEQVKGASVLRRVTQMVIEVALTQIVHPFGEPPFPEQPPWTPAYMQGMAERQELNYASFYGPHAQEIVLGRRGTWTKVVRR